MKGKIDRKNSLSIVRQYEKHLSFSSSLHLTELTSQEILYLFLIRDRSSIYQPDIDRFARSRINFLDPLHPESCFRVVFDSVNILFILYDLFNVIL